MLTVALKKLVKSLTTPWLHIGNNEPVQVPFLLCDGKDGDYKIQPVGAGWQSLIKRGGEWFSLGVFKTHIECEHRIRQHYDDALRAVDPINGTLYSINWSMVKTNTAQTRLAESSDLYNCE
jgi:hypothetical protein